MKGIRITPSYLRRLELDDRMAILSFFRDRLSLDTSRVMAADFFIEDDGSLTVEAHVIDNALFSADMVAIIDVQTFEKVRGFVPPYLVDAVMMHGETALTRKHFGDLRLDQL